MWLILKSLFLWRKHNHHVMLYVQDKGEVQQTHINGKKILLSYLYVSIMVITITLLLLSFTPLGIIVFDPKDIILHNRAKKLQSQLEHINSQLEYREKLLSDIRHTLLGNNETFPNLSGMDINSNATQTYLNTRQNANEHYVNTDYATLQIPMYDQLSLKWESSKNNQFPTNFPADGNLTQLFDPDNGHYGIDIAADKNTPFYAIADGTVINRAWTPDDGFTLHIQHSNGLVSIYKHVEEIFPDVGSIIRQRDILGTVGNTGLASSGTHLHIETWRNGIPINPLHYFITQ